MVQDDGLGMSEKVLVEAMRLGTKSPLESRETDDLGRFGLGLKTASFSQCTRMTVYTVTRSARGLLGSGILTTSKPQNAGNLEGGRRPARWKFCPP